MINHKLTNTIRNTILNYKDTVNSKYVADKTSCEHFQFIEPYHKHIITIDLRIVVNFKLRKFLNKGANYRETSIMVIIF